MGWIFGLPSALTAAMPQATSDRCYLLFTRLHLLRKPPEHIAIDTPAHRPTFDSSEPPWVAWSAHTSTRELLGSRALLRVTKHARPSRYSLFLTLGCVQAGHVITSDRVHQNSWAVCWIPCPRYFLFLFFLSFLSHASFRNLRECSKTEV